MQREFDLKTHCVLMAKDMRLFYIVKSEFILLSLHPPTCYRTSLSTIVSPKDYTCNYVIKLRERDCRSSDSETHLDFLFGFGTFAFTD